jgi:hypothetical protein
MRSRSCCSFTAPALRSATTCCCSLPGLILLCVRARARACVCVCLSVLSFILLESACLCVCLFVVSQGLSRSRGQTVEGCIHNPPTHIHI